MVTSITRPGGMHACLYRKADALLRSFAAEWASTLPVMSRLSVGTDRPRSRTFGPWQRSERKLDRPRANRVYLLSWHFRRMQGCDRTGCWWVRPSAGYQATV